MVFEHQGDHATQWAAIGSIASKIGCSAETLRNWVRQAERDSGARAGPTSEERDRIRALEREVRELRQANEILRKASAYFAQAELDRPSTCIGAPTGSSRFAGACRSPRRPIMNMLPGVVILLAHQLASAGIIP
jgi:transposase